MGYRLRPPATHRLALAAADGRRYKTNGDGNSGRRGQMGKVEINGYFQKFRDGIGRLLVIQCHKIGVTSRSKNSINSPAILSNSILSWFVLHQLVKPHPNQVKPGCVACLTMSGTLQNFGTKSETEP